MIRVQLPPHLRTLAGTGKEVQLEIQEPVTLDAVVGALEDAYPTLLGTIRDYGTKKRRPMVRYFACERDLSHNPTTDHVPPSVANGSEPFIILGAISGG